MNVNDLSAARGGIIAIEDQSPDAQYQNFIQSFNSNMSPTNRIDPLDNWRRNSITKLSACRMGGQDMSAYERQYEQSAYKLYKMKIMKLES